MGGGVGGWGALITIAWWAEIQTLFVHCLPRLRDAQPVLSMIRSLLTEVEECTACFKYDSFIAYRGWGMHSLF